MLVEKLFGAPHSNDQVNHFKRVHKHRLDRTVVSCSACQAFLQECANEATFNIARLRRMYDGIVRRRREKGRIFITRLLLEMW